MAVNNDSLQPDLRLNQPAVWGLHCILQYWENIFCSLEVVYIPTAHRPDLELTPTLTVGWRLKFLTSSMLNYSYKVLNLQTMSRLERRHSGIEQRRDISRHATNFA